MDLRRSPRVPTPESGCSDGRGRLRSAFITRQWMRRLVDVSSLRERSKSTKRSRRDSSPLRNECARANNSSDTVPVSPCRLPPHVPLHTPFPWPFEGTGDPHGGSPLGVLKSLVLQESWGPETPKYLRSNASVLTTVW